MDYKVSFGQIARTILYKDSTGTIRFTFDIGEQKTIVLERPGRSNLENDEQRISIALDRTREYLVSCGYQVEIFLG